MIGETVGHQTRCLMSDENTQKFRAVDREVDARTNRPAIVRSNQARAKLFADKLIGNKIWVTPCAYRRYKRLINKLNKLIRKQHKRQDACRKQVEQEFYDD